jgi:hypothetical protein
MQIERIATPSPEQFRTEYVLRQRPVILTDMFAGQAIAQLSTAEAAIAVLGDMPLLVQEEFTTFALRSATLLDGRTKEQWSFRDYLAHARSHPETRKMSTEANTPEQVRQLFTLPACVQQESETDDRDIASLLFVGNAGNCAHLHFDGDYRQVLLHQVFGTKRAILIPAIAARKLNPIRNFSSFFLEHFTESEKTDFVTYLGGWDCLLHPGETLFMPAGIWHYLDYQETGMSFSIRFGRTADTRFLGDKLHPNMHLQAIAAKLLHGDTPKSQVEAAMQAIGTAYYRPYGTPLEKGQALQRVCEQLYQQLHPEIPQGIYAFTNFAPLIDSLLQADSQRLYATPFYLTQPFAQFAKAVSHSHSANG